MSGLKAAFDAFKALYTADTGVGGLNETSGDGAAKVRAFLRSRDRTRESGSDPPLPFIRLEAFLPEFDATGVIRVSGLARMVVEGDEDRDVDKLDTIDARLRTVYHEASASATGWSVSTLTLVRTQWLPNASGRCRLMHEYRFKACKT